MKPRDNDGTFQKGIHYSSNTEFKKGQHWREPKPYWDKTWLEREYIKIDKSAKQIADEQGCIENNILYFLKKHNIKRKTMEEIRSRKYWGLKGEKNPMYGRKGDLSPHWKGGISPERQAFYYSQGWKSACSGVWKRDGGICQRCKRRWDEGIPFHVHHITSFAVKELRAKISNLVILCSECHQWVHSRKNINKDFITEI